MYHRIITEELEDLARSYPVVTVTGPRQSGKTTLVKNCFPNKPYVNLEAPDTQEFIRKDPRGFLEKYPEGAILDEIQRVPELLSYIQVIIDEKNIKGMFILTGSHQLGLFEAITQSLAGRTALLKLLPLSLRELELAGINLTLEEYIYHGGYPRIFFDNLNPSKAYRNYFQTYLERDLRQLIQVKNLGQFQKFVRMCAGRIGQILNYEGIANDVGVSSKTIKEWISILEASFVIFKLEPYFENFGKRVIKSPKLYFSDVGLATYLLDIENPSQISRDPLKGNLVENLVVLEIIKSRLNKGLDPKLYFFRDAHGHEVDLIFKSASKLVPIEIKTAKTFHKDFLKNLKFFKDLVGEKCENGFLIYSGDQKQKIGDFSILKYTDCSNLLDLVN